MPDLVISNWVHAHAHPALTNVMWLITWWHSLLGVSLMSSALALLLYHCRDVRGLRLLLLGVPGIMLLNALLKQIFQRARPEFDDPLTTLASYSFPSGHTAVSTVFYGVVALLLLERWKGRSAVRRIAVVVVAVSMVFLVGASRVYLGAHYLSDVLGAMLEGCLWLALCAAMQRALQSRSEKAAS